ncbi:MAG: 50S ribosomal protein L9 [Candidatus Melainabacteria bacterium]|nr:50S ribosomal protein L9 [Candidatus Melainabacteria bacterium]
MKIAIHIGAKIDIPKGQNQMATALKVILTEDSQAGRAGELVKVRPGFARNYLLPQKLAVLADAYNLHAFEERKATIEADAESKRQKANDAQESLGDDSMVTIEGRSGETGKLFGAITKEKIAEAVTKQLKIEVKKEQIEIKMPIKALGEHPVTIKLAVGTTADILVKVVPEN